MKIRLMKLKITNTNTGKIINSTLFSNRYLVGYIRVPNINNKKDNRYLILKSNLFKKQSKIITTDNTKNNEIIDFLNI